MKVNVYSLTADGDNLGIESVVYATEQEARDEIIAGLEKEGLRRGKDGWNLSSASNDELKELWEDYVRRLLHSRKIRNRGEGGRQPMTYSCANFTDDVLETLGIKLETDEERNDPETQAAYADAEIRRLQDAEQHAAIVKARLVELIVAINSEDHKQDLGALTHQIVVELALQSDIDAAIKF